MKFNWKSALQMCLKFLVSLTTGIAVFLGLTKLLSGGKYEEGSTGGYSGNGAMVPLEGTGKKIIDTLKAGQTAISNAVGVFSGVVSTAVALNKMFDRRVYEMAINQPNFYNNFGYGQPDPSMYFRTEQNPYPCGQLVQCDGFSYIQRSPNHIEMCN